MIVSVIGVLVGVGLPLFKLEFCPTSKPSHIKRVIMNMNSVKYTNSHENVQSTSRKSVDRNRDYASQQCGIAYPVLVQCVHVGEQ